MNDVFDRVRAANPVEDLDRFVEVAGDENAQLMDIKQRIIDRELPLLPRAPALEARRRWRVALAAAVVVAVFIGIVAFVGLTNDTTPEIGSGDLTPLETVELHIARFEQGDIEGMYELFSPNLLLENSKTAPKRFFVLEEGSFEDDVASYNRLAIQWYVEHATMNAECTASGNEVTCDFAPVGLLGVKDENGNPTLVSRYTDTFIVENGLVVYWNEGLTTRPVDSRRAPEYKAWLQETYPEDHADLYLFDSMLVFEDDQIQRHHNFIAEWAASHG